MSLSGMYIEVIHNQMPPLLILYSTVFSWSVQKFTLDNICEWAGHLPRCVFGSWMSETGVCEQSTEQAEFSGEQRSAILCISLTSLALNGARTRGQGLGPLNDGWHCWEQWRLMLSHVGQQQGNVLTSVFMLSAFSISALCGGILSPQIFTETRF